MSIPTWNSGLQEIATNVFAYIHSGVGWDICNSGFIVSDYGVMVIYIVGTSVAYIKERPCSQWGERQRKGLPKLRHHLFDEQPLGCRSILLGHQNTVTIMGSIP